MIFPIVGSCPILSTGVPADHFGRVSYATFAIPLVGDPRIGLVSWAEFEMLTAAGSPRIGEVSWTMLEVEAAGVGPRSGEVSFSELELPG